MMKRPKGWNKINSIIKKMAAIYHLLFNHHLKWQEFGGEFSENIISLKSPINLLVKYRSIYPLLENYKEEVLWSKSSIF